MKNRLRITHVKKTKRRAELIDLIKGLHEQLLLGNSSEWVNLEQRWKDVCYPTYCSVVPDKRALRILHEFSPLIQFDSGTAYWSYLMKKQSINIVAHDVIESKDRWTEILPNGPKYLLDDVNNGRNLFLCHPESSSESLVIAMECLNYYNGNFIIHVGDLDSPNYDDDVVEFSQAIKSSFHCLLRANLSVRLPWTNDCISVWKRTAFVGSSPSSSYSDFNKWYFSNLVEQEKMLSDRPRMNFYHTLIQRHIQKGDRVLDIGTGTGVLALFAARCGADVIAIDHSEHMIEVARKIAVANNIQTSVEFLTVHSKELEIESPVDVILHEQIGDCLFDEDMLANICDARDRFLKPGGRILPNLFHLFCEPVELDSSRNVPFVWEMDVHGLNFSCLRPSDEERLDDDYYHFRSSDPNLVKRFVSKPSPVLTVDLYTAEEDNVSPQVTYSRSVLTAGVVNGLVVYFNCCVDDDLVLSSGPEQQRAPHWGFRILRTSTLAVDVGDILDLELSAGHWPDLNSWRWDCRKRVRTSSGSKKKARGTASDDSSLKRRRGAVTPASSSCNSEAFGFISLEDLKQLREQATPVAQEDEDEVDEVGEKQLEVGKRWPVIPPEERLPDFAVDSLKHLLEYCEEETTIGSK